MQRINVFRDEAGELYDVPEADREAFLAEKPTVRPVQTYRDAAGELYDVPEEDAAAFRAEKPDAEPARTVSTADGEVFDVPESGRAEFLKDYRTAPEFEADRTAARATVQAQGTQPSKLRDAAEIVGAGLRGAADVITQPVAGVALDLPKQIYGTATALLPGAAGRGAKEILETARENEAGAEWAKPSGEGWANVGTQALRSMAPQLALSLATKGRSRFVQPVMYAVERGQDVYDRARERGIDEGRARKIAMAAGLIEGVPEAISSAFGGGKAAAAIGRRAAVVTSRTVARAIGQILKTAGVEGATEFVQEGGGALLEKLTGVRPDANWLQEGMMAAASGALSGWLLDSAARVQGGRPGAGETRPGAAATVTGEAGAGGTGSVERRAQGPQSIPGEAGVEMGPPEAPGVPGTALVPPPLPMTPEMQARVPLLDQGPLPAAPVGQMMGPTVESAAGLPPVETVQPPISVQPPVAVQPLNAEVPKIEYRIPPGEIKRATYKDLKAFAQGNRYPDGETVWDRAVGRDKLSLQRALLVHRRAYMDAEGAQERAGPSDETRRKLSAAAKRRMVDRANTAESEYVAAQKIREVMGSEQQVIPEDELNNGDMVFNDGQWYKVAKRANGVTVLEDGVRIEYDRYSPVPLQGVVTAEHPAYDAASEEYQAQEQAEAQKGTPKQVIKGDAPAVADGDAGFEFGAEKSGDGVIGQESLVNGQAEDLQLDVLTPEELEADAARVEAERAAEAQRREIAVRAAKPIEGNAGDQTMVIPGMEGEVDTDLFDAADQQARLALGMEEETGDGGRVAPESIVNAPISAAAVEANDVALPAGYVREGDLYVFRGGTDAGTQQTGTAVPPPAQPGPGGAAEDMEAAAAARGREGAITLPGGVPRGLRAGLRRIGALFMPNRGVGDTTYDLFNEMNRKLSAANMAGREFRNRIRGVVNGLQDVHGRDNVMAALREVQEGDLTPEGFSGRFGLARGNDVERFLGVMLRDTEAASQRILKWSGRSKEARANVAEQTFYQTRAYLVHALGEGYDPPESARRAASLEFKAGLADAVQRLAVGASAVRGRRGGLDVVSWLETGDETFLRHASRTRADAARTLRGRYLALRGMIDELAVRGDHVTAKLNAEAATRAADGFVEFYLKRSADRGQGGGGNAVGSVETGHLRARFLEGALRNLYGEITDPAVRQQITTEVQARMLAEMTFFERVFAESEGAVWAYQPDLEKGIVERLGDAKNQADRMKYGDMAGRYVTAEFKGLIDAARNKGAVHETMKALYFGPMGFQRMAKLLAPKTISRNYITGLMGFGLQSGDVFLPGYWRDFGEGHRLAVDYARGRPDAITRLRELTELGVFAAGGTSATADMQAALGGAGARMAKLGKGVTEAYAFIDFPTKYAAFKARQRSGMSRAQAVQHVQELYQNRERTPAIVGKVSRIGLADYLSYSYDSTRIAVNGMRHAVAEAKAGRLLPMFGWITARSLFALTSVKATQMASEAVGKLYAEIARLIRPDDDDEKKGEKPGIAPLESAQLAQMRKLVMPYDANAPLLSWRETQGGRLKYVGYTVAGGQTAFPIDDWIVGLLQSPEHGEGFLNAVGGSIAGLIDEGMYVDTWARAIGGSGFDGKRTPTGKGLWHVLPGKEEPERAQIIGDAIKGWIADMAPTYPAKMFMQLMQRERDMDAGIENVGIFARRQRSAAEIVVAEHRLVRSYTMNRTEMNAAVRNAIRPQLDGLERTREIVSGAERQRIEQGAVRPRNEAAAQSAQEKRSGYVREVADTLKAAQAVAPEWWDVMSINLVLKESGMPQQEIYQVLNTVAGAPTDTRYFPDPDVSPYRTRIYQDLTR